MFLSSNYKNRLPKQFKKPDMLPEVRQQSLEGPRPSTGDCPGGTSLALFKTPP